MADFRYGYCIMEFDKMLTAKKLGADYIELNLGAVYDLSDEKLDEYKIFSKENGIAFETANCIVPGNIKLVGSSVDYTEINRYLSEAFRKAAYLGVKYVVFGSSGARSYPDGTSYDKAFEQLVIFLREHAAPMCEKYDIICVLEDLSFGESNILNLIDESYKMVRAVDSPRIKILVDFYHFGYNKDSFDSIRKAKDLVSHIHVASLVNDRGFPALNDGENYQPIADLLREIGYDKHEGRISFEANAKNGKAFDKCVKESLEAFKSLK